MIRKKTEIVSGMIVRHIEGVSYRVDDVRLDARDYEQTHRIKGLTVNYTQMVDGHHPAGTKWNMDEPSFRKYFTIIKA